MSTVVVRWEGDGIRRFQKQVHELQTRFPKVLPRIVNQVGNRAKTQVIRKLTVQTGLPRKTIVSAVKVGAAGGKKLSYDMVTRGGNIRLKYLNPRETPDGVVAKPFGKATLYPGAFLRGGSFPGRKNVDKFKGHAFYRLNKSGTKITYARSGVFIPTEMTTGATSAAFRSTAAPLLQERVEAAITKLLK